MPRLHPVMTRLRIVWIVLLIALLYPSGAPVSAAPARNIPALSLPTPPGENWTILQGYACGSHNSWDRYSLDLVSAEGRTYGAPVRAAADGVIYAWTKKSGTLILHHGDGVYTMYTHMASAATTQVGAYIARGQPVGTVGDRGAPGTPHLHFTAFTADGAWARNRQSFALAFVEGVRLPEVGGCSQHQGERLVAGGGLVAQDGIRFEAAVEPGRWTNQDLTISFGGQGAASGHRTEWGRDPGGDTPATDAPGGRVSLAEAGEGLHTLYVRGWDAGGQQTLATYGPVGYDTTPPQALPLDTQITVKAGDVTMIRWPAAEDSASGVAGYRVYIGADPDGISDWYTPIPEVDAGALAQGVYLLRVQPIDYAGNTGAWLTLGQVIAE